MKDGKLDNFINTVNCVLDCEFSFCKKIVRNAKLNMHNLRGETKY